MRPTLPKKKDSSNQKDKRKPPKNPKKSIFKRKKMNFILKLEKLTQKQLRIPIYDPKGC
jgi:hypothetical protein